jgi:hypothetical protein
MQALSQEERNFFFEEIIPIRRLASPSQRCFLAQFLLNMNHSRILRNFIAGKTSLL